MAKAKHLLIENYLFAGIFLFFLLSYVYLQYPSMKSNFYGCPVTQQNGNSAYFSRYYEDYILSLIFSQTPVGFYIDAGAYDPSASSVTQYFYKKGWQGINIEPLESNYQNFVKLRPRDVNLNVGVGARVGKKIFYQIVKRGLSTFDKEVAAKAKLDGFLMTTEVVQVTTLDQILKEHPVTSIQFLKINVEGFEKQVLEGINLKLHRPQVIIVEALAPRTNQPNYQEWEPLLLTQQYRYAFFDGLNRYYVADEHSELLEKFELARICLETSLNTNIEPIVTN